MPTIAVRTVVSEKVAVAPSAYWRTNPIAAAGTDIRPAKAAAAVAAEADAISAAAARKSKRDPQVADIVKLRKAIGSWDTHRMAMFALMQAANTDGVEAAMLWINPERGSM